MIRSDQHKLAQLALWMFLSNCILGRASSAGAEPVVVHYREGVVHGFLVLRSLNGQTLAAGDLIQVVNGDQVTSEVAFHFQDGSLHDETTVYSQDHAFRLLSDHLVQRGPSFPHPIDIFIDARENEVTIRRDDKGKQSNATQHIDLPEDISNGMMIPLLRNISPSIPETKVAMLVTSSRPRLVKLSITPRGERAFSVATSTRKATNFDIKVEIGGVSGKIAPLIGKQPPDTHVWMSTGESPTFVRSEGPFYEGGPVWRTDLASLRVSARDLRAEPPPKKKSQQ